MKELALVLVFNTSFGMALENYYIFEDMIVREVRKRDVEASHKNMTYKQSFIQVLNTKNDTVTKVNLKDGSVEKMHLNELKYGKWKVEGSTSTYQYVLPETIENKEPAKVIETKTFDQPNFAKGKMIINHYYNDILELRIKVNERDLKFFHFYKPDKIEGRGKCDFLIKQEFMQQTEMDNINQVFHELTSVSWTEVDKNHFLKYY